jgi:deoxyribose-phosphate aldolase
MNPIAPFVDYTLLRPNVSLEQVRAFAQLAVQNKYHAVCVAPYHQSVVSEVLFGSPVKLAVVVGFPLGLNTVVVKVLEAELALQRGAQELDVMLNVGAFLMNDHETVVEELDRLRSTCMQYAATLKVIIETGLLDEPRLQGFCRFCADAGVDFVKTSSGFVNPGAEIEKVKRMRHYLPESIQIKASGGIKTAEQALAFLQAGASRIGTSVAL